MVNQQLLDYIKQQKQQGANDEEIKRVLLAGGWQSADVEEAFNSMALPNQPEQPELPQQPKKINKILLGALIFIIGVLIAGGGAFGYFYYFQSPEKIVQKMTTKVVEIKSLEYSGEVKLSGNAKDLLNSGNNLLQPTQSTSTKKIVNFLINFNGASDTHDLNNPKGLFSFNIKTDALPQGDFTFGVELRAIDKIIYIKLSDAPNLDFFDLSVVKNQWIKIDIESLKKQFGLEKFETQIKEAQKKQELSPEQIEKLKIVVRQSKIFKIIEKLPSEKVGEVNTYHYKFIIDKEEIKKLFIDIVMIVQDKALSEKELEDFNKGLELIKISEGEIWIGKNDFLPYKIFWGLTLKEPNKSEPAGSLTIVFMFKNYNKSVQIDIPTPVKTLEEILASLLGGLFGKPPQGIQPNTKLLPR